MTRRRIR